MLPQSTAHHGKMKRSLYRNKILMVPRGGLSVQGHNESNINSLELLQFRALYHQYVPKVHAVLVSILRRLRLPPNSRQALASVAIKKVKRYKAWVEARATSDNFASWLLQI
jgi:hypothetical protein